MRYWLALLKYQQALAVRPDARPPVTVAASAVNLAEPTAGQVYAKLGYPGRETFLVDRRDESLQELSYEWPLFFEDWLALRYRRGEPDASECEHLVIYPTLRLPRGKLGGLLRFPVELEWLSGDQTFGAPSYGDRRKRVFPAPPDRVRLKHPTEEPDDALPFFVDGRALTDVLHIPAERVDQCLSALRKRKAVQPREVVWALSHLIEGQTALERGSGEPSRLASDVSAKDEAAGAVLSRLQTAVTERLVRIGSASRAFALALVVNGNRSRSTWHLERDIAVSMDLWQQGRVGASAPLSSYLTGRPQPATPATCWGRWRGVGLTESQLVACELALGSRCSAVQGPPGTGKTTLILNMLAHALVLKVSTLEKTGNMGSTIMVATSTNNRAVDTVVDPLGRHLDVEQLALSLRVGSRQVVERVSLPELERARQWLEGQASTTDRAGAVLEREVERFRVLRSELEAELGAERTYQKSLERKNAVEAELEGLGPEPDPVTSEDALRDPLLELARSGHGAGSSASSLTAAIDRFVADPSRHALARAALGALARRLEALSELAGAGCSRSDLAGVARHWTKTRKRQLARVEARLGFAPRFFLPPELEPHAIDDVFEAWEEGAETALAIISRVERALSKVRPRDTRRARRVALEAELQALRTVTAEPPPAPDAAARERRHHWHRELFESAVRVREAWASSRRSELLDALAEATEVARGARSLRTLMQKNESAARWLRQLFPAWGCTLLSLGNAFPPEQGSFDMVVIDEAGQCHPAYAIAALLRAKTALVIGDVNQLEPVVELSPDDERRVARGLELRCSACELEPYRVYDSSTASAQALADRAVVARPTLIDHFRCQPAIAAISEALCGYGLVAHTPLRSRVELEPALSDAVLHFAVDGAQERFAGSWVNGAELEAVLAWTVRLLSAGIPATDIGIITPFRGQLEKLWRALRAATLPLERPSSDAFDAASLRGEDAPGVAVGTVHRFQGGERSIILFSTCVTRAESLPFLNDRVNLVNVAASRAREHLITIGHTATLSRGRYTRHLLQGAKQLRW